MATDQGTVDDLLERLADAGRVTARKMFGEYCLYLEEKPVALVCDGELFVKTTEAGRKLVPEAAEGPPYKGAKPHLRFVYEEWTDRETLCRLLRATFDELPAPKPRKPRTKKKK